MKNMLFAVLVALGVMSCYGSALVDFPSLSEKDRTSFTEEEDRAFPQWEKYEEERYPDAVVRVWKSGFSNKEVRKATEFICFTPHVDHLEWNGEHMSVNGEWSLLPPLVEMTRWSITTIGTKILYSLLSMRVCIRDTQKCSTIEIKMVAALRERPIELGGSAWDSILGGGDTLFRKSSSLSTHNASMLRVTQLKLLSLIGRALDIQSGKVVMGQCETIPVVVDFRERGDEWDVAEPFRSNIILHFAQNDYLAYQSLQPLEDDLVEYQKALNGCYAETPNRQEAEALQRGKDIMSWILADAKPIVSQ